MQKLKDIYYRIPEFLRNRYFILGFLFLIWISFIDENNLVNLNNKTNNLENLQDEIDSLSNEIIELEARLERLNTDPEELERFARENFLMKKDGEDIIIIRETQNE